MPTAAATASTVTVSGSVHDANGDPIAGGLLITSWAPLTGTSTAADGSFSLEVAAGLTTMDLIVLYDATGSTTTCCTPTPAFSFNARASFNPEGVGPINLVVPSLTSHTVQVMDSDGEPLVGIALAPIAGPDLELGSGITWSTGQGPPAGAAVCTTAADGTCSFLTFDAFLTSGNPGTVSLAADQTLSRHPAQNLAGSAPMTSPTTTIVASTASPEALVTGTVRDGAGDPVVGARVRTSVGSTTATGSDGVYTLWVLADSSTTVGAYAQLDPVSSAVTPPPVATGASDLSTPCEGLPPTVDGSSTSCQIIGTTVLTQVSGDLVLDLSLPSITQDSFHVTSATGVAIDSATVIVPSGVQRTSVTSGDGTVTTRLYAPGSVSLQWASCTTGIDGDCDVARLSDLPAGDLGAFAFKGLSFGAGGTISVAAYGTVDHITPPLTTIHTAFWTNASQGDTEGQVTVVAAQPDEENPDGRALSDVDLASAPDLPVGVSSPVGELSYTVSDVPVGGTQDVYIALPDGSAPTAVYKNTPEGLVDVSSIATITGDTIVMHLTDGGFGDEDGEANGVIVDPVIPVRAAPADTTITAILTRPTTTYGQRTVLKTTTIVNATGRRASSGTMTVTEGTTTHGTCTVTRTGTCNLILPTIPAGTHTLTATYTGPPGTGSTTANLTVSQATTRAIIRGPLNSTTGSPVTFTARAWTLAPGRGIPTGTITFTDGTTPLATVPLDANGYASLTTSALAFGGHTITATYNGSPNHTTSLKARTIAIK